MTFKVYSFKRSGAAIVEAALAECEAPFERIAIDLMTDAQRDETYRTVNPQRKIPTLITPEGATLTESAAILLVLDEGYPDARLLPARGSPEREQALRWLVFAAAEIYPIIEILDYPARFCGSEAEAPSVRAAAERLWRARLTLAEEQLGSGPYFLGETFSAVDIYLAVVSRWGAQNEWRPDHVPKLETLFQTVKNRPKIAPVWEHHFAA